jgi:hypothetical protein
MRAPAGQQTFVDSHGHGLIENKTLTLPVLVPELFLVGHDSAGQLKQVFEAVRAKQS